MIIIRCFCVFLDILRDPQSIFSPRNHDFLVLSRSYNRAYPPGLRILSFYACTYVHMSPLATQDQGQHPGGRLSDDWSESGRSARVANRLAHLLVEIAMEHMTV